MKLNAVIRDCVAFLGLVNEDGKFLPRATTFRVTYFDRG